MKDLTRFQLTALARLIARDLSGGTPMKIDCRSLDALERRGLVRYDGPWYSGPIGQPRHRQAMQEKNTIVTGDGIGMMGDDDRLADEVQTHLRLEHDRALERAGSLEATARMLRRRAEKWAVALHRVDEWPGGSDD